MSNRNRSILIKGTVLLLGAACVAFAAATLPLSALTPGLLALLILSSFIAPRMSLTLPRSTFAISFSEATVFLAFILFGGSTAILLGALESFSNCYYLRSKGFFFGRFMIPTNVSINVISITLTYLVWMSIPPATLMSADPGTTPHLVSTLGGLAISHFVFSSMLVSMFAWLKNGTNPWIVWKNDCFATSMAQIVGAGLAGLVSVLISFGDPMTAVIASGALTIAYLSYRSSINEVKEAMTAAEAAERQKAEAERERRREAERYAGELAASLEKEEMANEALRKSERDLQHAALFDSLTGLPNRKNFGDQVRNLIKRFKGDQENAYQVLFLDIQKFKNINDSLGHSIGDKVLMVAAKRFVRMLDPKDMVARLGGDEFAIVLRDLTTSGKAEKVARRIRESISQPFSLSGNRISLNVNIGIASCDVEYDTTEEVLRDADIAMHYAKEKGTGIEVFSRELRDRFLERVNIENSLSQALDKGELSMVYQPLIAIQDGSLLGFEALLRWNHPEVGQIPPGKFIPIAEESGLIIPITKWILGETCNQIAKWQRIAPGYENLMISINISGKHLSHEDLLDDVENAVETARLSPASVKLEITESAAMENAERTITTLNRLKLYGVQLSIDDFGTGYSSLSYLHRLPFDMLKIDRAFVYSVGERGENSEILQTIIALAKSLKKKVIAEGIETESQLLLLRNLGCDYGQGYLLARPQTVENIESLLYKSGNWLPDTVTQYLSSSFDDAQNETSRVVSMLLAK